MKTVCDTHSVQDFIEWHRSDGLILNPDFRRHSRWDTAKRSAFVSSLIAGYPTPLIIMRERSTGITGPSTFKSFREVVDGTNRLYAVLSFIVPESFDGEEKGWGILPAHTGELVERSFTELLKSMRQQLLNYHFSMQTLPENTSDSEVQEIIRRMGGVS